MNTVKVALVIQNCIAGNYKKNLESTEKFIILFPEMNLTGYATGPDIKSICKPVTEEMASLFSTRAKILNVTIMVGLAEITPEKKIYASHLIFNPGQSFEIYRKIHTAPFEKTYFSAGNQIPVFTSHGLIFGVQLCYDAHFPELSLAMALKKADVIFLPHASPRGSSKEKYHSWIRHLTARAFDNGMYIAACNQTGDNSLGLSFPGLCVLIGPDGKVIYRSTDGTEGVHMLEIEKSALDRIRSHKMRYFLPNRRSDLFKI